MMSILHFTLLNYSGSYVTSLRRKYVFRTAAMFLFYLSQNKSYLRLYVLSEIFFRVSCKSTTSSDPNFSLTL
jgi:hypothetical protein